MTNLKNHPAFWLREDAAEAFNKAEDKHGIFHVNSAGRTVSQQQELINRWAKGGIANRPPYLYKPANPASASNHVAHGGIAIDIANWKAFAEIAAEAGFVHLYPGGDPVHFEFTGTKISNVIKFDQATFDRQKFLNTIGYNLVVDGRKGDLTTSAYKKYQSFLRAYGYAGAIDGDWQTLTQAAHTMYLKSRVAKSIAKSSAHATIHKGSKGSIVKLWQNYLKTTYPLYAGNLKVDGDFGSDTDAKTKEWQKRSGLKSDGIVGSKSWAKSGL